MAENKQVFIEFKVDSSEALQATVALTDKLNQLKATKKELEQQLKQDGGNKALKEQLSAVNSQIGATGSSLKSYQKELQNVVKAQEAEKNSLEQQRTVLANLTTQWDRMSEAERSGSVGIGIAEQIEDANKSIINLEQSTGKFQSNISGYKEAIANAGTALQGLGIGASGAVGGIQKLGVAFKALIANPIGAAITAIVVVFQALKKAFKENDDAGTNLARALSIFQPIVDAVKNAFSLLADVLGKVALGVSKVYTSIYGLLIPGYKDAAKAADDLVVAQDKLEDKQREATVENAKNNKKIADNNAKIADKEKTTAKERIKLLKENAKLEKQNLDRNLANAREEYRIAKAQSDKKRKLSDEDKDRLANLYAAMVNLEADYSNSLVSINKKTSSAIKEVNKEEEDAVREAEEKRKAAAERAKQRAEERVGLQRQIEQGVIDAMNDGFEKEQAQLKLNYKNQIEEYKKAQKEKPYLADYYNQLILQAEAEYGKKSVELIKKNEEKKKAIREQFQKHYEDLQYRNLMQQYDLEADSFEKREKQRNLSMQKELSDSIKAEAEALKNTDLTEQQKTALKEQFERQRYLIQQKYNQMSVEDANKTADAVIAAYQRQADAIDKKSRDIMQSQMSMMSAFTDATASMSAAVVDALTKATGDEEKYQKWKIIMSIIDAQIQGALAIMSAITTATPGDPYSVAARIASAAAAAGAATITAVAELIALKSQTPAAPKFAMGGLVTGPGTGTSDSITAQLSNGESVMTAKTTQMFAPMLSAMNVAGGGAPITQTTQTNAMQGMFESMFENMPAPVVSVKEITTTANRVQLKESIAKSK